MVSPSLPGAPDLCRDRRSVAATPAAATLLGVLREIDLT
jgi:hypothetical protein